MKRSNTQQASRRKEEIIVATGVIAGATVGAIAGAIGMIAGAIFGGVVGMAAGHRLVRDDARASGHDADLDHTIGVSGGDMGAASANQPHGLRGANPATSARNTP